MQQNDSLADGCPSPKPDPDGRAELGPRRSDERLPFDVVVPERPSTEYPNGMMQMTRFKRHWSTRVLSRSGDGPNAMLPDRVCSAANGPDRGGPAAAGGSA